jgi:hypothetical protein
MIVRPAAAAILSPCHQTPMTSPPTAESSSTPAVTCSRCDMPSALALASIASTPTSLVRPDGRNKA